MSFQHWEDFDENPKPQTCGECGQKGWHLPNCPGDDGDDPELQDTLQPV